MTRKLSILFLAILIVFSPFTSVLAQESVKDQSDTESMNVSGDESENNSDKAESEEEKVNDAVSEEDAVEQDSESEVETENESAEDKEKQSVVEPETSDEETISSQEEAEESVGEKTDELNASMYSTSSSLLKNGMRDARVVTLKKDLAKIGFPVKGNETTYFGNSTEQKVKEFQAYYGLTADGVVGTGTFAKIDSIINSPLQYGKRHADTVTLKQNLGFVGLPVPGNGTSLYGKGTEEKVKEFQRKNGLVTNGIADEVTLRKLDELAVPLLKDGVRHKDVVKLKNDLNKVGFKVPGNATTYFGAKTKEMVQKFQKYYGISADGVAGEKTLDKLAAIVNSPLQNGRRHKDTIQLKADLANVGFIVPGNGTSLYGAGTEKIVKIFQKSNGLVVNGIADEITLAKIKDMQSNDLRNGVRHPDVIHLKRNLEKVGFKVPGNGTNYFGSDTEKIVKEFQGYYGLKKNGIFDSETSTKLDAILNSPFQLGKRHPNTPKLKSDLGSLGFPVPGNGTTYYGSGTVEQVIEFQKTHNLRGVNGIADEVTLKKIEELMAGTIEELKNGVRHPQVVILKQNLDTLGFKVAGKETNYFGRQTEQKVKEFQSYYGLGADGVAGVQTIAKIESILSSPFQEGVSHSDTIKLKKNLAKLGFAVPGNGTSLYGKKTAEKVQQFQTKYGLAINGIGDEVTLERIRLLSEVNFKETKYNITLDQAVTIQKKVNPQTDRPSAYVSKEFIDKNNKVTASVLNVRVGANVKDSVLGTLKKGDTVTILGEVNGWYQIAYKKSSQFVSASLQDIKYYLDPRNFLGSKQEMLQFLDLSKPAGAPEAILNKHLSNQGILNNKADAFIKGANEHQVNEAYLISHALLESGRGTSDLATGVKVGLNSKGKPTVVTKNNEKELRNKETVYNMYGIGAVDSRPLHGGAERAYTEGWFSPQQAIIGGAKFVGEKYIHANPQQNTLYKMRWNPDAMERNSTASHQYATDIGWANKQTNILNAIYKDLDISMLNLDLPFYK